MSNKILYPKSHPLKVWEDGEKVTIAKVKAFFDLDKNRTSKRKVTSLFQIDADGIYSRELPALEVGSHFNSYLEKRLRDYLETRYGAFANEEIYSKVNEVYLERGIRGIMESCVVEFEEDDCTYSYFTVKYVRDEPEEDSEVALRIANRLRAAQRKASAKKAKKKRQETLRNKRMETYLKLKKEFEGE